MGKYIWIGHRESELYKAENIFDYSITSWGSGKEKNISYSNLYSSREIDNNRNIEINYKFNVIPKTEFAYVKPPFSRRKETKPRAKKKG